MQCAKIQKHDRGVFDDKCFLHAILVAYIAASGLEFPETASKRSFRIELWA